MTRTNILLLALLLPTLAASQHSPYAGMDTRDIKALSPEQVKGYLAGEGMGMAMAAELNGYPGPKHVLDLAAELELTPEQAANTRSAFDEMQKEAVSLGRRYVEGETELDSLFASRSVTPDLLSSHVSHLGQIGAQIRLTHLKAHLTMMDILSTEQVSAYQKLRGYGGKMKHDEGMMHH